MTIQLWSIVNRKKQAETNTCAADPFSTLVPCSLPCILETGLCQPALWPPVGISRWDAPEAHQRKWRKEISVFISLAPSLQGCLTLAVCPQAKSNILLCRTFSFSSVTIPSSHSFRLRAMHSSAATGPNFLLNLLWVPSRSSISL